MKLFSYYRSSSAYRVRIVLNLKGIEHSIIPVNLLSQEHLCDEYRLGQPQGLVPSLKTTSGDTIFQSGAIIDYLEAYDAQPKLKPTDQGAAISVRTIVDIIACDIQPICNLRVLKYLTGTLGLSDQKKSTWYQHWIREGFAALEETVTGDKFCVGEQLTLAEAYLVPQIYNALRFNVDMTAYPKIMQIYQRCNELTAFEMAKPENQADSPSHQYA